MCDRLRPWLQNAAIKTGPIPLEPDALARPCMRDPATANENPTGYRFTRRAPRHSNQTPSLDHNALKPNKTHTSRWTTQGGEETPRPDHTPNLSSSNMISRSMPPAVRGVRSPVRRTICMRRNRDPCGRQGPCMGPPIEPEDDWGMGSAAFRDLGLGLRLRGGRDRPARPHRGRGRVRRGSSKRICRCRGDRRSRS